MSQSFAEALSWVPKSRGLAAALARAHDYARSRSHGVVTLEHLLLALTSDRDAGAVLQACAVDLDRLNSDVASFLSGNEERLAGQPGAEPTASPELVRIIEYATAAARQSRRREVNGAIVLAAIVGDGQSPAAGMLRAQGLTFEAAIKALQRANAAAAAAQQVPARPDTQASQSAPEPIPRPAAAAQAGPASVPHQPSASPPPSTPQAPRHAQPAPAKTAPEQTTEEILADARRRLGIGLNGADTPKAEAPPPASPVREASAMPQPGPASDRHADVPRPQQDRPATDARSGFAPVGRGVGDRPPPPGGHEATVAKYPPSDRATPPPPPEWHHPTPDPLAAEVAIRPKTAAAQSAPQAGGYHLPQQPRPDQGARPSQAAPPRLHPHPAPNRPPIGHTQPPPPPGTPPRYDDAQRPPQSPRAEPPPMPGPAPQKTARGEPSAGPQQRASAEVRRKGVGGEGTAEYFSLGQLGEFLPRRMMAGVTELIEVHIPRAEIIAFAENLQGSGVAYRHDKIVSKAMSVRLRAPDGGFWIESASPETQWIENSLGLLSDDYASWRWAVTPRQRGKARLQLIISARTVGSDGVAAETALPDQFVEVKIRTNYQRLAMQWAGWLAAALVGGILATFGGGLLEIVGAVLSPLGIF